MVSHQRAEIETDCTPVEASFIPEVCVRRKERVYGRPLEFSTRNEAGRVESNGAVIDGRDGRVVSVPRVQPSVPVSNVLVMISAAAGSSCTTDRINAEKSAEPKRMAPSDLPQCCRGDYPRHALYLASTDESPQRCGKCFVFALIASPSTSVLSEQQTDCEEEVAELR